MKFKNLNKNYNLFTKILIWGGITISCATLYFSYQGLLHDSKIKLSNTANKINSELEEHLTYIENLSNFVSNQIANKKNITNSEIATILVNTKPRIDQRTQNIMTWTLFDFLNQQNQVIASSSQGLLTKKILITNEQRSWVKQARIKPWQLLHSYKDIGTVSGEETIPLGFGVTKENGEFLGILSLGINIGKIQRRLETLLVEPYITFILTDQNGDIIFTSQNIEKSDARLDISKLDSANDNITLAGKQYCHKVNDHQFHILVGIDNALFLHYLRQNLLPKIFNTFYLTIFFLVILYFLKIRFLKPIVRLSRAIGMISQGNLDVRIPKSGIPEVNHLSRSVNKMKDFLVKEENLKRTLISNKDFAEDANCNKTEFLASTAHELKNMLAGIIGLGELIKINLTKETVRVNSISEAQEKENLSWINDIIKLGEESSLFVNDILDVNQAQTGDFRIETVAEIDLEDIILRSINLLKTKAISEKKNILTNFHKRSDDKFVSTDLDPRRMKQIIVNIISNAIKYSGVSSVIEINMRFLSTVDGGKIGARIQQNIDFDENSSEVDKFFLSRIVKKRSGNRICIEIRDQGVGMSEEELEIALQRYGTIQKSSKKKIDSTGLGLPIVKYLVEAQGGLLDIKSSKGDGTSVKIIF